MTNGDLLEFGLVVNGTRVGESLRHGFFTELLRPDVLLERLVGRVVRNHLVLQFTSISGGSACEFTIHLQ